MTIRMAMRKLVEGALVSAAELLLVDVQRREHTPLDPGPGADRDEQATPVLRDADGRLHVLI